MKSGLGPGAKAALVAGIAISHGHTGEGLVGDVVSGGTVSGWERAAVAGGALIGHAGLGVVPGRGLPCSGGVAGSAIGGGGEMGIGLAGSR